MGRCLLTEPWGAGSTPDGALPLLPAVIRLFFGWIMVGDYGEDHLGASTTAGPPPKGRNLVESGHGTTR